MKVCVINYVAQAFFWGGEVQNVALRVESGIPLRLWGVCCLKYLNVIKACVISYVAQAFFVGKVQNVALRVGSGMPLRLW